MKKSIIILVLVFLFYNCIEKKENHNTKQKIVYKYTPPLNYGIEYLEVDIDSLSEFNEILTILDTIDCTKKDVVFKMETEDKIYKIQPLQYCGVNYDYYLNQIIYINTDSITVNHDIQYPIDSLKTVLDSHLTNKKNDINYPSIDEEFRIISIHIDSSKKIKETKQLLLKIITEAQKITPKSNFVFIFNRRGLLPQFNPN